MSDNDSSSDYEINLNTVCIVCYAGGRIRLKYKEHLCKLHYEQDNRLDNHIVH
jgi:hypothetical protein